MQIQLESGMALRCLTRGARLVASDRAPTRQHVISMTSRAFHNFTSLGPARPPPLPSTSSHSWCSAHPHPSSRRALSSTSTVQQMRSSPLVSSAAAGASQAATEGPALQQELLLSDTDVSAVGKASPLKDSSSSTDSEFDSERCASRVHASISDGSAVEEILENSADEQPREKGGKGAQAQLAGAFQRLSMVQVAKEHLSSAQRRAMRVGVNKKLKNEAQQARNKCASDSSTPCILLPTFELTYSE